MAETARAAEQQQRKKAETYLYYNKIVLAEREWAAGHVTRVTELLQQCPQEARGWEWRYLDQLCRRELSRRPWARRFAERNQASISVEDKRIGIGRYWLSRSGPGDSIGQVTHELGEKFQPIWLEVSPDGKLLVSVGWIPNTSTSTAKLWDATTGTPIQELSRMENPSGVMMGPSTFSLDGR